MKHTLLLLLATICLLGLSACSSFNLTEQLSTRLVPVVVPDEDGETFYELNGKCYCALTVAMAEEHIPLISASTNTTPSYFLHFSATYTPDMTTAQTYLFQLTDVEAEVVRETLREIRSGYRYRSGPLKSKDRPDYIPPVVKAQDFDFSKARRFTHPNVTSGAYKSTRYQQFEKESPYHINRREYGDVYPRPIAAIPAQEIPLSLAARLAYGPVWVLDAAGNLVINTVEAAFIGAGAIIVSPCIGLLYLCGGSLP